jgi:uracil-DNA glycosylase
MQSERDQIHRLHAHVAALQACRACSGMQKPVVTGSPVLSKVLLVGQAPGDKEPKMGKPFAWTAGKTLFGWFKDATGLTEEQFRERVYMAAVCRCFPGKKNTGGDRVPNPAEIGNCSRWLDAELRMLQPELVIPVGRLAISQFIAFERLEEIIGRQFRARAEGLNFDLIPLPHPSGASPWHRMEPGRTLLHQAMELISQHPAFRSLIQSTVFPHRTGANP